LGSEVSARWLSFYAGQVQAFAGNQPGVKFEELFWPMPVILSAGTLFEFWIWKFDEEEF
jgi:hypothetical protein